MRAQTSCLVVAWSLAIAACATHREYVREADVAAMNARGGETESLCPAPPRAIGGGPGLSQPAGSVSLGSVVAPDDATPQAPAPAVRPRTTSGGSNGSTVPSWWNSPPPVVIENGPSPTIGPGGSGFTIRPGY